MTTKVKPGSGRKSLGIKRKMVYERDHYRCRKCGFGPSPLEIHHIKNVIDGGSDELENLISLCYPCHREWTHEFDGNMDFWIWLGFPLTTPLFMRFFLSIIRRSTTIQEIQDEFKRMSGCICGEIWWIYHNENCPLHTGPFYDDN